MLTIQDCNLSLRAIRNDIHIREISEKIFVGTQFGSLKAKLHSFVMIRAEDKVFWFAPILVLFQLSVPGGNARTEDYAFVQYFEITKPVDE